MFGTVPFHIVDALIKEYWLELDFKNGSASIDIFQQAAWRHKISNIEAHLIGSLYGKIEREALLARVICTKEDIRSAFMDIYFHYEIGDGVNVIEYPIKEKTVKVKWLKR